MQKTFKYTHILKFWVHEMALGSVFDSSAWSAWYPLSPVRLSVFILVYKYCSVQPESACCRDYTIPQHSVNPPPPKKKTLYGFSTAATAAAINPNKAEKGRKSNFSASRLENKLLSLPGVSEGGTAEEAQRLNSQLLQSDRIKEGVQEAVRGPRQKKLSWQKSCEESCRDTPSTNYLSSLVFVLMIHIHTYNNTQTALQTTQQLLLLLRAFKTTSAAVKC